MNDPAESRPTSDGALGAEALPRPVLEIDRLTVTLRTRSGAFNAVEEVSFVLNSGETLGVVGESGCGKSMMALAILRLIPTPPARITHGEIRLNGTNLVALSEPEIRSVRGNDISMIFQEPMTSLNPLLTVGRQIVEPMTRHQGLSRRQAEAKAIDMLRLVQIPEPERRFREYPHQLSGGMRQRVMIAMALACDPQVLIADEPTTALDVTIQAEILDLMSEIQRRLNTAIVLITHDMGVIAENTQRVVVMYAGQCVEYAGVGQLFADPQHPYTLGLLRSVPVIRSGEIDETERLHTIPGVVPSPRQRPEGCIFNPRCAYATDLCRRERPPFEEKRPGHWGACFHSDRLAGATQ